MGCFGVQHERKLKQSEASSFSYPARSSTDSNRQFSCHFASPTRSRGESRPSFEREVLISRCSPLRHSASFNLTHSRAPFGVPPLTKPPNFHPAVCNSVAEGCAVRRCSSYGYGDDRSALSCSSAASSIYSVGDEQSVSEPRLFRLPLPPSASLSSSTSSLNCICSDDASSGSGFSVCAASPRRTPGRSVNSKNSSSNPPSLTSSTDTSQSVQSRHPSPLPLPPPPPGSTKGILREFSQEELAGACLNFAQEFFVRDGGLGPVFRTVIKIHGFNSEDSVEVAVTRLKYLGSQNSFKKWRFEVSSLARLSHPHLCKVAGFSGENCPGDLDKSLIRERERLLVYENPPNGSLDGWLYCRKGKAPIDWATRLKIAVGAAQGLAYLHCRRPRQVIYKSFKSINIQLDANFDAKLSDYGFAATAAERVGLDPVAAATTRDGMITTPEGCVSQESSAEGNVWCFGIVLLELLTGRQHNDDYFRPEERDLLQWCRPYLLDSKRLYLIMDPELKGRYSTRMAKMVANLALQCLAKDPADRPSMPSVAESLRALAGRTNIPAAAHHGRANALNSLDIANANRGTSTFSANGNANHGSRFMTAKSHSLVSVLASPARVFARSDDANARADGVWGQSQRARLGALLSEEMNKTASGLNWPGEDHRDHLPSRNCDSMSAEMGVQSRRISGLLKWIYPFSPDSASPPPLGRAISSSSRLNFISG